MRTMYDSTRSLAHLIPADATIVAGYVNGRYAWTAQEWGRFPNAEHVAITIYIPGETPPDIGLVLDVEANDAPKARQIAANWVAKRRAAGIVPCIYTSTSGMRYLGGLACDYWLADPTGIQHLLPGTVATQWRFTPSFDLSACVDDWPRPAGKVPLPMPNKPCVAFEVTKSGNGYWLVGEDGGVFTYGDAEYFGSILSINAHLNGPVVAFAPTPTEKGYWIVASDYGVFSFGDAQYLGHP